MKIKFKRKTITMDERLFDALKALVNHNCDTYFNVNQWTIYATNDNITITEYATSKEIIIYKDKLVEVDPKTNLEKILGKSLDRDQLLDILGEHKVFLDLKKRR